MIAASDAQFFDPHVSVGQVVAIEAIGLMRKMPVEAVMRMAFVGRYERMSAQRAYELGMISQIVDPPERLRDEAQELAEKIAKNSPAAMAGDQAGAVGRARARPHRRLPAGAGRAGRRCGATPTRPRARWRSPRSASRVGGSLDGVPTDTSCSAEPARARSATTTTRRRCWSTPAARP